MAIDFWFAIGSTYTYLAVMRLGGIARETGIAFKWRPFSVREIMVEMANQPFVEKPVKMQYMWHDIERRAAKAGAPGTRSRPTPDSGEAAGGGGAESVPQPRGHRPGTAAGD